MRNMSFMLTTDQIRDRSKTVTRRLGWRNLKVGERLQACEKCQGRRSGEPLVKLAVIEVVSVRPEPLWDMAKEDCAAEGFPGLSPDEFVSMFCVHMGCDAGETVNRIEFKYVD